MICRVQHVHVEFLTGMAIVFGVMGMVALVTGKAYYRRVIEKEYEPKTYWMLVLFYWLLAVMMGLGLVVCPR